MTPDDMLKNIPLFAALSDADIRTLSGISRERTFSPGEAIVREGDRTTEIYVVLGGRARAYSPDAAGNPIVFNTFSVGDYFGEMSFIDGEPRSATVEAVWPTRTLAIRREALEAVIRANPDASLRMMRRLSGKLRKATRQIEDLAVIVGAEYLDNAHLDTIRRLVTAAEYKDRNTGDHIDRISAYSARIAAACGLDVREVEKIRLASPMHDIGKIGIPEGILAKPGPLTPEEFEVVKTHPLIGARILANPGSDLLECARRIALCHHERHDGLGYPHGAAGDAIPLAARIVGIADVFDALTSERPYKAPYPPKMAVDMIREDRGRRFDPDLTDRFMDAAGDLTRIRHNHSDGPPPAEEDVILSERDRKDPGK